MNNNTIMHDDVVRHFIDVTPAVDLQELAYKQVKESKNTFCNFDAKCSNYFIKACNMYLDARLSLHEYFTPDPYPVTNAKTENDLNNLLHNAIKKYEDSVKALAEVKIIYYNDNHKYTQTVYLDKLAEEELAKELHHIQDAVIPNIYQMMYSFDKVYFDQLRRLVNLCEQKE